MPSLDRHTPPNTVADADEVQRRQDAATLWAAIRADRRAQDERTARLRAMLSAVGDDRGA